MDKTDKVTDEFTKALGDAWGFIKGDGSFTSSDIKNFTKSLSPDLARRVLAAVIFGVWSSYGGKKAK